MSLSMWAWRVIVPGLGLVACSLVFWQSTRGEARAIVAPTSATASAEKPRPARARVVAEGRIAARPGAEVTVGTESGGIILAVPAREKAVVKKGDLLVEFVADDLRSGLAEAEARLEELDAEINFGKRDYQRRAKSPSDAPQFQAEMDGIRRDLDVATARRKGASAAVAIARSALGRARVTSPIDGVVIARYFEPGEIAAPGARLVTVCDLSRLRVEAEVDEFDAGRVREGDEVVIRAEGSESTWEGKVEEVPDQVAGRTARPEDPGRPTDVRVLRVKIAPRGPLPLKLGQQVEVEIETRPPAGG